ncbi:MAG: hypothetical protein H7070_12660 [Saprospiraceae bacterium]|nr:hypothetical protein [Pyrinomonadaceae bacterium]
MFDITFLNSAAVGDIFAWAEVSQIHKIRNGIYQKNGRLISLLTDFGRINPCYPDFHGSTADTIFYTGSGRRGDQKLDHANQALLKAVETEIAVPLFNKLSVGRWEFMGFWRIIDAQYIFDERQSRMLWKFTLSKTQ